MHTPGQRHIVTAGVLFYNEVPRSMATFISYRREDAAGHAGRLCDRLNAGLGADRVFMDVEDVRPGQDFVQAIDDTVARCDHLLVVIGPRWLEAMTRRATAETDFVRHEILSGLRRGIPVVPVLVAGATMPQVGQLPPDLAELSRRNAFEIRDGRFDDDVRRLVEFLGGDAAARTKTAHTAPLYRRRPFIAAVALVAALLTAFLVFRPAATEIDGEWIAEMQKPRQPTYRIGLTLTQTGEAFSGTVRYPTGDGPIYEGTRDGEIIAFYTSHVPQFESEPAIIRYRGTIEPDGIRLVATDEAGTATGVARRVPPQ